jgi:hypothetical protein
MRAISWVACLIVVASFIGFAVSQTNTASAHQQAELVSSGQQPFGGLPASSASGSGGKSGLRRAIDDAANTITAPFSGLANGARGSWGNEGMRTVLALIVYGFGLGFLARLIRLHA